MTGPEAADSFLKNIMAAGICEANGCAQRQQESNPITFINDQNGNQAGNAYVDEILLDGDKQHELAHYSGLKMLVDPVE